MCGKGNFYYPEDRAVWYCWNCNTGGDWFKFLELHKGMPFLEALKSLAAAAGMPLKQTAKQVKAEEDRQKLEQVRLDYLALCQTETRAGSKRAERAAEWLKARGYRNDELTQQVLASPDPTAARAALLERGWTDEDLLAAGLLTSSGRLVGWGSYLLVIVWYVRTGLAGFVFRTVDPDVTPKYLNTAGLEKSASLLGLPEARALARQQERQLGRKVGLLLVEGVLDAIVLTSRGLPAAAVGGKDLSERQAAAVQGAGFGHCYLALDNDTAGQGAVLATASALSRVGVECYIARPEDYGGYKDPDELYRASGIKAVQALSLNAVPAGDWLAAVRVAEYPDLATNPQQERELLRTARADLNRFRKPEDRRGYMRELERLTPLTADLLTAGLAAVDRAEALTRQRQAVLDVLTVGLEAVKDPEQEPADLARRLAEQLAEARGQTVADLPARYSMDEFYADLARKTAGLPVFFDPPTAKREGLTIPAGAITVLSGGSGGGKTTAMLNLLVYWLRTDPTGSYYMFSYEERRADLWLKLLMVAAGHVFQPETNLNAYRGYLTGQAGQQVLSVDNAIIEVGGWLTDGRLTIYDEPLTVAGLTDRLDLLTRTVGKPAGVVIDYLQKVPLPEGRGGTRYLDLQQSSGRLLETAVRLDIPVLLGAQLNGRGVTRGSDKAEIREAQDIEFDAALWLNLDVDKEDPSLLTVKVRKNRAGLAGQGFPVNWNRPARTMEGKGKQ